MNKFHSRMNSFIKFTNDIKLGQLANMLDGKNQDSETLTDWNTVAR